MSATERLQQLALLELSEARAALAIASAAMAVDDAGSCGFAYRSLDFGTALVASRLDLMVMNRVVGLGVAARATPAMIDSIFDFYRDSEVRRFAVQVAPDALPGEVGEWLAMRGATEGGSWCKLRRTIGPEKFPEVETELRVTLVSREHAPLFGAVVCAAYGFPEKMREIAAATIGRQGWRHYLAWDGALPVAAGALNVHDEVAWLGMGCTLPARRGRGAQSAIIRRRLEDARELGCRLAVTETAGEDVTSCRNLLRAGFDIAYARVNHLVNTG